MAMNTINKFIQRRDILNIIYQNVKSIKADVSLAHSNNVLRRSHSSIIRSSQLNWHMPRFYSVKTVSHLVDDFRNEHNITVLGEDIPSPYIDIESSEFPEYIKTFLNNQGFTKPTVIQSQGWPVAMSGKNFVGIAQTGTGKTLAYLLPAVAHIKEKSTRKGRGPIALILAPTRELARQIEEVAKDFRRLLNVRCVCVYGGASRSVQASQLQAGVDIVIATPGRLNDFITSKTTSLARCTYVVLDEADRMLDMGFEPQIRQVLEEIPLERQILMFSATWPKEVRHLAKDFLGEYVQVNVGSTELTANQNIKQHIHVCDQEEKMDKFKSIMQAVAAEGFGKILVFANTKKFVDSLALTLRRNGWPSVGIHGDKTQLQRDTTINKYKSGKTNILVATDVAARGLDVDGVTHVINYDFPNTTEDYIHRIGRTGRQQNKGVSHTIITEEDERQAKSLIEILKDANQEIPLELKEMARSFSISKSKGREVRSSRGQWNGQRKQNNKQWNRFGRNSYDY